MIIYYQGAELPTYRNIINEMKIASSSVSYMGLRKRTKFTKGWDVTKYFPEGHHLFVDSGCSVINNAKEEKYERDELRTIADHYYSWIDSNIESIELFSEFDAHQLGSGFINGMRDDFRGVHYDKVLPIWGGRDSSIGELRDLGERFGRVGIAQTTINGRDIVPILNRLAQSGVELHGLAMTKPDIMQAIPWTSVSSTSWTTPQRYGDTIIWSHGNLKRYPKSMKEQARKKERFTITNAGFDYDKIRADDPKELLRMSLWSWQQLMNKINKTSTGVTAPMNFSDEEFSEVDYDDVGTLPATVQKRLPTASPRDPNQKRVIPFIDFDVDMVKVKGKDGKEEEVARPKVRIRSESMRLCDTCFLAPKCPMFEENTTCAYDIPIQVDTREQMEALMNSLVSMQTQRVLFMKMAEDMEGSGLDPILSGEIDRLGKLIEKKHSIEQEGFSLTITAKQQGQMNTLDRLFGDMTNQRFDQLDSPVPARAAIENLGMTEDIIDIQTWEEN